MARTRGSTTQWTVDTTGVRNLSRALRRIGPTLPRQLGKALKAGGEVVAIEARSRASWSTRIPGSITVTGGVTSVKISAGSSLAPHAAAFENKGQTGTFRHPVFGHDVWVDQGARPFLTPALEAKSVELSAAIDAAIDETLNTI